ncbi:AGE family epimerase/isomerase [Enterococcus sp. JM9B]|uniref:AGE family epimerase/isomerase n=1 Tax=Enterococcus sp. JM9B TaxID=1857216 RepID=UPI001374DD03|nr:AGE family epimerase/isomerase [Enterococcus sp. JM9B]KAF1304507.1 hypothetical protein BAU16_01980 [Enterococcus sp. JM9B]
MELIKRTVIQQQLIQSILPFWLNQIDLTYGGFTEVTSHDLRKNITAAKHGVMQSRYLWALSAAQQYTYSSDLKMASKHSFDFIKKNLWDKDFGGIYWQVDYAGETIKNIKVLYAQSFALYAFCEYYKTTKDETALSLAKELFHLIEMYAFRENGYTEEFSRDWQTQPIHEVGIPHKELTFTTNTHLHLLEAYTSLHQVWPNPKLQSKILFLLELFQKKIMQPEGYCNQFFTEDWRSLLPGASYGHDIETSWLLDRGQIEIQTIFLDKQILDLADYSLQYGIDRLGLMNNSTDFSKIDKTKVWWIQAESVIGFYNAYQKTKQKKYLQAADTIFQAIQTYFIDSRQHSEWFGYLSQDNPPIVSLDYSSNISDNWKGPYHTIRMYLELINRLEQEND